MRWAPIAVVVGLTCATSGCGTLVGTVWPKKHVRKVVKRPSEVTVRAVPEGAVVMTADGKVLGPAPHTVAAEHDVIVTWSERSNVALGVGLSIAAVSFFTSMSVSLYADDPGTHWYVATAVTGVDLFSWIFRLPFAIGDNQHARREPRRAGVPRDVSYRVRWTDFDPVDLTVRFPSDSIVVATRPTAVTFDQALLSWERGAPRKPTPKAMLHLGAAHLAYAEAGQDTAAATKAVEYLEGYLRSDPEPGDERTRAETLLAKAKRLAK